LPDSTPAGSALPPEGAQPARGGPSPASAYIIANVDVTNPEQYESYKKLSTIAMKAHGAEVCVRGGKVEVLEGDWGPARLVMLKFPSMEQARAFYNSVEYEAARQARQGASVTRMIVVEGV
jgi:uncharacterized protein (DUF1330 family)